MYGLYGVGQHNFLWSQPLDHVSGGPPTVPLKMGQIRQNFEKVCLLSKFRQNRCKTQKEQESLSSEKSGQNHWNLDNFSAKI